MSKTNISYWKQVFTKLKVPKWMGKAKYKFGTVLLREDHETHAEQDLSTKIVSQDSIGVHHNQSPDGDRSATAAVYTTSSNEVDINVQKGHITAIPGESFCVHHDQSTDVDRSATAAVCTTSSNEVDINVQKGNITAIPDQEKAEWMFSILCSIMIKKLCSIAKVNSKIKGKQMKKKSVVDGNFSLIFSILRDTGLGKFLGAYIVTNILLFEPLFAAGHPIGNYPQQAAVCIPIASDSSPDGVKFRQIECEISTCANWEIIIYERADEHEPEQWTPVLEVYNDTYYNALDTESYALGNRIYCSLFPTIHTLYIHDVNLEDTGKWRCVVMERDLLYYQSEATDIVIYVTPTDDNVSIEPGTPVLVKGASQAFTCTVNGIHPVPDVVWTVNGVEQRSGNLTKTRQDDGLWNVKHSKTLHFATIGLNNLSCQLRSKDRNPLLVTHITFDVKAPATLSNPKDTIFISEYKNSQVILNCSGSGYKPVITWVHNDNVIVQSYGRYNINQTCNESACVSSLTFNLSTQGLPCGHTTDVVGDYRCVISLGKPYQSNQISPAMYVNPQYPIICHVREVNPWMILVFIGAISIFLAASLCFVCKRKWKQNAESRQDYSVIRSD